MAQAEPQRQLWKLIQLSARIVPDLLHVIPDFFLSLPAEILIAKIVRRELGIRPDLAGEAALVKWNARNHSDIVLPAIREQLVFGRLIEDVVDHLHAIDQPGGEAFQTVSGLMVIDRDADGAHFA